MALYAFCMYPHLLCNVDVMISTLQKRLQDELLSLVGLSSSFRIGSHLGRDMLSFGFNLAVFLPSDRKGCKTRIVLLPSRIKRWGLYHIA